jgi:glycyl-tRNA synthetase beta chain
MPDLLLELFSEEIPARMQSQAAGDLERLVVGALSDRGLLFEAAKAFAGPRRLTLAVEGLPAKQRDVEEERKGPRVNAPEKAIEGFLRSANVTLEQCVRQDDGKGEFYVARVKRMGRNTADALAEFLPEVLARLPWPKSMRWPGSDIRWVRPLRSVLCTLDGEVVPFEFAGLQSGNTTLGHRFLSHGAIAVRRYDDYESKLREAHVILAPDERRGVIRHELEQQAFARGLEWIVDEALLDEVKGLVEWPVVLFGRIDPAFMDVPGEILQTAMRTHQKYFALRLPGQSAGIADRFAFVANMQADDGGAKIIAGNERVLRARLSDAQFFWEQDRRQRLEKRVSALRDRIFHAKAGTMLDRACRISLLAMTVAEHLGSDAVKAGRAGWLAKADLVSGVVGEFPELQGVMGYHFALADGEDAEVAEAIRDQYRPAGPADRVPDAPVSVTVALAEKVDTLMSLWRAGEKPTGSKDPFALRRAGLGIIRIVLDNGLRLPLLSALLADAAAAADPPRPWRDRLPDALSDPMMLRGLIDDLRNAANAVAPSDRMAGEEVLAFLADRLKVALKDRGARHDLIDAVFSLGHEDDLVRLVARVDALQAFLATPDGADLLAGYRRGANILRIEEKKDGRAHDGEPDPSRLTAPEEVALFSEMGVAQELVTAELAHERFADAMTAMARLRAPVDAFFEKVTVNAPEPALRLNRLMLLSRLRSILHHVADFSKIEG